MGLQKTTAAGNVQYSIGGYVVVMCMVPRLPRLRDTRSCKRVRVRSVRARTRPVQTPRSRGPRESGARSDAALYNPVMRITTALLTVAALAALAPASSPSWADDRSAPSSPVIGKSAPDFTLKDLAGKEVKLASYKGKVVVLEWFNPGCPFVKRSHTVGSLVDTAKRHTKDGVVWLAINSGSAGKQGADAAMNAEAAKTWSIPNPILRDEAGAVGKAYGATNTPNMFVIDKTGTVVYAGAIDNSPDGEGKSPQSGKLVNYVDAALDDVAAGRPVKTAVTRPYGCTVKYGS
jgi:peroxiredoxin